MADDEQFSLCWNNFNTNLSAGFHESLCRGDLVDVTLAAEGQLVKAHRLVLSVCSPYFRKMFTQMPANQHAFVFLKDVSHSALKDLIQFMYCGEVNVKQDALPAFISTAEALQIKGLTENGDGPSAPAPHPSPAKESTIVHSTPAAPHPVASSRVGQKIVQRGRVQSYKVESEESSDEKAQTVHVQPTPVAQKRTIARTITPSSTPVMKRAKITTTADPLEASEPTVQTIQIVKNVPSSEPEYVEMPIETINPKSEPEYVEDTAVIEGTDQEHDDTETHEIHETEEGQYVEDESYGDMKYDESYFTEGDDTKAGASGFGESYAEGADQSASEAQGKIKGGKTGEESETLKELLKKQVESIEWLKKKNRRLENSLTNMEKANTEFQMKAIADIKVEKGWEEVGSDSFSCNDDSSFMGESSRQATDDLQPIFKQFDKIPRINKVKLILSLHQEGQYLMASYAQENYFTEVQRGKMVTLICRHFMDENIHWSQALKKQLAFEIEQLFPTEPKEVYFSYSNGTYRGKIVDKVKTLAKRKRNYVPPSLKKKMKKQ